MEFVKPETIEVRFSEEEAAAMKTVHTVLGTLVTKMDKCELFYLSTDGEDIPRHALKSIRDKLDSICSSENFRLE